MLQLEISWKFLKIQKNFHRQNAKNAIFRTLISRPYRRRFGFFLHRMVDYGVISPPNQKISGKSQKSRPKILTQSQKNWLEIVSILSLKSAKIMLMWTDRVTEWGGISDMAHSSGRFSHHPKWSFWKLTLMKKFPFKTIILDDGKIGRYYEPCQKYPWFFGSHTLTFLKL